MLRFVQRMLALLNGLVECVGPIGTVLAFYFRIYPLAWVLMWTANTLLELGLIRLVFCGVLLRPQVQRCILFP